MKKIVLFILLFLIMNNVDAMEARLAKCIDGDTASFVINNEIVKVRFLAVDTPEYTTEKEAWGKEASEYVCESLTTAKSITLELDLNSDEYDKYDRLLAWIFVDSNLLQSSIIEKGLGEVAYLYGDYKYTDILQTKQLEAQNAKIGIWSSEAPVDYLYVTIVVIITIYTVYKKVKAKSKKKLKIRYS